MLAAIHAFACVLTRASIGRASRVNGARIGVTGIVLVISAVAVHAAVMPTAGIHLASVRRTGIDTHEGILLVTAVLVGASVLFVFFLFVVRVVIEQVGHAIAIVVVIDDVGHAVSIPITVEAIADAVAVDVVVVIVRNAIAIDVEVITVGHPIAVHVGPIARIIRVCARTQLIEITAPIPIPVRAREPTDAATQMRIHVVFLRGVLRPRGGACVPPPQRKVGTAKEQHSMGQRRHEQSQAHGPTMESGCTRCLSDDRPSYCIADRARFTERRSNPVVCDARTSMEHSRAMSGSDASLSLPTIPSEPEPSLGNPSAPGPTQSARQSASKAAMQGKPGRWLALDLVRFCAVFLMVQGHVFSSLLDPSYEGQRWLRHHNFVHGYTAPMFLFASGLAFGYTTFRGWAANTKVGDGLWKRYRRYGWLLAIGYAMAMPALSLTRLLAIDDPHTLRQWLRVDVLQHIGLSLVILQSLAVLLRTEKRFIAAVGLLFLVAVFAAPFLWDWDAAHYFPTGIAAYLTSRTGSMFPLFPWAGFTYAGVLVAYAARSVKKPSRELAWPLLGLTLALFVLPVGLNRAGIQLYGAHDFWKSDPYYFFFRLANVLAIVTFWCFVERFAEGANWLKGLDVAKKVVSPTAAQTDPQTGIQTDQQAQPQSVTSKQSKSLLARVVEVVRIVGAESLLIYVTHLVLLHGSVLTVGFIHFTGRSLTLGQAAFFAGMLFVAMVATAWIWHEWKKEPWRFRILQWGALAGFAFMMLTTN